MARIRYIQPVDSDLFNDDLLRQLESAAASGTKVDVVHLSLPPELAGPMLPVEPRYHNEIVDQVLRAQDDGCDAVIIGCCSDPALPDCQRAARIPVIGPLQAAAAVAASRGRRLGILFPDEHAWKTTANWVRGNLRAYGLADVVGPIRFVPMRSDAHSEELIGNTDLSAGQVLTRFHDQLVHAAVPVAKALLSEDEAQALFFGCTLWGGMVDEIAPGLDALSLDPVRTALRVAELQAGIAL